mgnify:CR=1 FL=1
MNNEPTPQELASALGALEVAANTVHRCYTHRPGNFAAALERLRLQTEDARATLHRYREAHDDRLRKAFTDSSASS